ARARHQPRRPHRRLARPRARGARGSVRPPEHRGLPDARGADLDVGRRNALRPRGRHRRGRDRRGLVAPSARPAHAGAAARARGPLGRERGRRRPRRLLADDWRAVGEPPGEQRAGRQQARAARPGAAHRVRCPADPRHERPGCSARVRRRTGGGRVQGASRGSRATRRRPRRVSDLAGVRRRARGNRAGAVPDPDARPQALRRAGHGDRRRVLVVQHRQPGRAGGSRRLARPADRRPSPHRRGPAGGHRAPLRRSHAQLRAPVRRDRPRATTRRRFHVLRAQSERPVGLGRAAHGAAAPCPTCRRAAGRHM
ncbi:MAG: hypothetical protein AVDCRST_MAG85-2134, partial [uncultured Solirubrobacteraceae bacterium]